MRFRSPLSWGNSYPWETCITDANAARYGSDIFLGRGQTDITMEICLGAHVPWGRGGGGGDPSIVRTLLSAQGFLNSVYPLVSVSQQIKRSFCSNPYQHSTGVLYGNRAPPFWVPRARKF